MRLWNRGTVCIGVVLIMMLCAAVNADETTTGRDLITKFGPAVVKVQLVMKMSMTFQGQGDSREEKAEATGTVIDPSGLTIISLMKASPGDMVTGIFGGEDGPNITTEIKDVKIRLADGKEVPGKVVLRDKDLDLAFIRPAAKPTTPWTYVDLKNTAKVDMLDQTVLISRMGKVANRAIAAYLDRIQAVVEKPRKFYTVGLAGQGDEQLGSPVFSMDGKLVGILLMRIMPGGNISQMSEAPFLPVIIPAEDIAPIAAQAPEDAPKEPAKPASEKKETDSKTPAKKTGK